MSTWIRFSPNIIKHTCVGVADRQPLRVDSNNSIPGLPSNLNVGMTGARGRNLKLKSRKLCWLSATRFCFWHSRENLMVVVDAYVFLFFALQVALKLFIGSDFGEVCWLTVEKVRFILIFHSPFFLYSLLIKTPVT